MQTEAQSKEISGDTYKVYMLPPRQANKILIRIVKTVGPSLGVFIEELDDDALKGGLGGLMDNTKIDGAFIGKVAKELCERLDENEIERMMDTFAKVSEVNDVNLLKVFDGHFHGKIGELYAWFAFALQANFQDFGRAWGTDSSSSLQASTTDTA